MHARIHSHNGVSSCDALRSNGRPHVVVQMITHSRRQKLLITDSETYFSLFGFAMDKHIRHRRRAVLSSMVDVVDVTFIVCSIRLVVSLPVVRNKCSPPSLRPFHLDRFSFCTHIFGRSTINEWEMTAENWLGDMLKYHSNKVINGLLYLTRL